MLNKQLIIGNLGDNPVVRTTKEEGGVKVANISVATKEVYYNSKKEKVEKKQWFEVVLWRGLAEVAEKYLKKGSQVYIEGRTQTEKFEDKEGNTRYANKVIADNMQMLGKKPTE